METITPITIPDGAEASVSLLDKDKLLKSIFHISTFLTAPSKVDEILSKILDETVDTIGFDRGIIRLFDETKRYLETKVVKNYPPEEAQKAFSLAIDVYENDCISAKVTKTGQPITIADAATDPRMTETDRVLANIDDRGALFCAPLKIGDEVIGSIVAWRREGTRIYPEEIDLFLTFANQMSIIIYNMTLFETNAEKIRQLIILQEAVSSMNSNYVLDYRIHDIMIESALRITHAQKALFCFHDMLKGRYIVKDGEAISQDKEIYEQKMGYGVIRQAIADKTVALKSPSTREGLFAGHPVEIAIPFCTVNKFEGALYIAKVSGSYSQDQVHVLDILVKNAITAYDNAIMQAMLYLEAKTLKTEVKKLKEREDILLGFHNILGQSKKMLDLFHVIEDVAGHNTNILIQGESGTGKELTARAIHRQSNRSSKPFVEVNCAAIPGTLLESELFGYEQGAFTDARKRKIGLLEYANGGTMLLDEIGDMSVHLQAKFLRVLEDGYIRRLGGNEEIPVDIRFVFATNKDLNRMVAQGSFREDLYYRISVVPILIPPLRERVDDIILLARYYVEEFNKKFMKKVKGFDKDAEQILKNYHWPGNVRELKNIIERIMILHDVGDVIVPENLPAEIRVNQGLVKDSLDDILTRLSENGLKYESLIEKILNDTKKKVLVRALDLSMGRKTKAATLLGISRYKFMREQKKINGFIEFGNKLLPSGLPQGKRANEK
ncbi:MAG: sigma-54-dependent Fis family transcriptional regulator [Deltaproteobacteria bacterium]|nr:sigma-54-dependent Fis family transcriptional regulator [Deltaproteobacteria bacterium]